MIAVVSGSIRYDYLTDQELIGNVPAVHGLLKEGGWSSMKRRLDDES